MNDRLADLGIGDSPAWAVEDNGGETDIEMANKGENKELLNNPFADDDMDEEDQKAQPKKMESFFRDVDSIKADIDCIKSATKRIGEINEEAILATTTDRENELSRQLKPLVDDTNKRAKRTKNLLAVLKEENATLKNDDSVKQNDLRIRENLGNTLTRKFIDEMKEYQQSQQKYKSDIKKKVKRQVQIVKPEATDEEVDAVMRSEGGRDALYKERILAGGVSDSVKTAYEKVAGKYQDVLTLEQSVQELHQMFLDFALLTEQQGELLDQIEYQVKSAGDYVEDANVEVHQALEYQKSARKKQCMILVIVVAVIIVVFVLVF